MARKLWALICAGVLGLAGCGSSDGGDAGGKVTLTYAIWDNENQGEAMGKIVKEFTRTHPDIDVEIQFTPNKEYWTKLQTAAAGGSAPDVFWMNGPRIGLYASQGALMPISDRIAEDKVDLGKFPKSLVDLYTLDGKQYGIPTGPGTYNTIYQAGGQVISEDKKKSGYDDPATIEGLKFWKGLLDAGVSPSIQQMTDNDPIEMFKSGKLAMWYDGSFDAPQYFRTEGLNADVAPLPAGPGGEATIIHGLGAVSLHRLQVTVEGQQWKTCVSASSASAFA